MAGRSTDARGSTLWRLVRSYGLLVLIAIFFLILAMFVREKPKTVPVEGIGLERKVAEWH